MRLKQIIDNLFPKERKEGRHMPTPGQELSSIDFESMIGGPLVAVIHAQAQAAMSTVNFIKEVGFKKTSTEQDAGGDTSTEEPIYVSFKYPKELSPYEPAIAADPTATPPVTASPAVPAPRGQAAEPRRNTARSLRHHAAR